MKQQRVPNADEFPVLGNLASPSAKSSGANGYFPSHNGPTAAQILQAPAPPRKDAFPMANGTHTSSESGSVKVGSFFFFGEFYASYTDCIHRTLKRMWVPSLL